MNEQNTPIDTGHGRFVLNISQLKPGDIILEHGYKVHSLAIAAATNSHYSHAMIYVGGTIMEATSHGRVYSRVPNRVIVFNQEDLKVLRLKVPCSPSSLKIIIEFARNLTGSNYSVKEALLVNGDDMKQQESVTREQFCSRLVAQSYSEGGVRLVDNIDFCSPGDLERSDLLVEAVDAVREASEAEITHAYSKSVHKDHHQTAVDFMEQSVKFLADRGVTTIFQQGKGRVNITTHNDIFQAVFDNRTRKELDQGVADIMWKTGHMDGPFDDQLSNPFRYELDDFIKIFSGMSASQRMIALHAELHKEVELIDLRIDNFIIASNNLVSRLDVNKNMYYIQYNMLSTMRERLVVIRESARFFISEMNMDTYLGMADRLVIKIDLNLKRYATSI